MYNTTYLSYPYVHEMVAAQAANRPNTLAMVWGETSFTYALLNSRANQLAHYLRTQNVHAEARVGVCMERAPDMIVGMLAILKVGGVYVPLDITYPREKLFSIIDDAQIQLLLSQTTLRTQLLDLSVPIWYLDSGWSSLALSPNEISDTTLHPENLAYIIYTSGSTGQPKGVQISHASLYNLVSWHLQTYQIEPLERATVFAGLAFDACTWEIWPYLVAGACLYLPAEAIRTSPPALLSWLVLQGITRCFLPTALAERLLNLAYTDLRDLQTLLTGGDLLHLYTPVDAPFTLVNHYGPTETTVVATAGVVPVDNGMSVYPTIGRPIMQAEVYILDDNLNMISNDTPGELYIGGTGVARGYLHQAALTAERFIPHPFSTQPGQRLYRTGDIVRLLANDELEFLGRNDQQVKIRGFRVEPGEIEAVLCKHPRIREAIVLTHSEQPGEVVLVAYLAQHKAAAQNLSDDETGEFRHWLQERLPMYMVPAAFVTVDEFPITSNGKVDRSALLAYPFPRETYKRHLVAPSSPIEEELLAIWQDISGREQIGVTDDFFADLGGHSLQAPQLLLAMSQAFHITLPLQCVFEYTTIVAMAVLIEEMMVEEIEQLDAQMLQSLTEGRSYAP